MITLDEQQQKVVKSDSRNILCIAGPGSGKTRTLIERAAYLIEEKKVSPYELALFTFTRKAAQEMRERIEQRIGRGAHHITIGTFHAVALRMLHRFGDLIGYGRKNITVYGEFEENYLLKECAIDLGVYKKSWNPKKKEITKVFHEYYYNGEEPEETSPCYPIFKEFITRCKENHSLTYGGLLIGFKLLLPHIAKYLNWKHIMVDEVHDNNLIQWKLVREIQKLCDASLFCVADLDQSIYKWRGAFPEWILNHQAQFDIYKLESNYRSRPEIVEASNKLINNNVERIPKTMRATRESGPEKCIFIKQNADSAFIAEHLRRMLSLGQEPGSIVVLSRIHILLDKLSENLKALGVPHEKIGRKTALTNSEEFRRFHAFLKLVINPYDNFALLLIRPLIDLSRLDHHEIRLQAAKESKSHFQVWLDTEIAPALYEFFLEPNKLSLSDYFLALKSLVDGIDCTLIFEETINFVQNWLEDNPAGTVEDYLEWLATYDLQDEIEETPDKVQLQTVHSVKGLEFPTVIIAGCNEGVMPSKQAIAADDIEEERRIFYTALTRAEDKLIIAVRPTSKTSENGHVYESPPSRFIKEMNL